MSLNDTICSKTTVNRLDSVVVPLEQLDKEEAAALEASKLAKLKKKINADSWSLEMEDLMKSWGEKAAGNRELHLKSAGKWKSFSDKMYLPLILLTTLGGVSTFGVANIEDSTYWMYGIGSINLISAFIAGVTKYYRPDEQVQAHMYTANAFGSFFRHMTLELSMSRADRQPADQLSQWAKGEYDRLLKEAPNIPGDIVNDYKMKHEDDQNKPDIIVETFQIDIHGRN